MLNNQQYFVFERSESWYNLVRPFPVSLDKRTKLYKRADSTCIYEYDTSDNREYVIVDFDSLVGAVFESGTIQEKCEKSVFNEVKKTVKMYKFYSYCLNSEIAEKFGDLYYSINSFSGNYSASTYLVGAIIDDVHYGDTNIFSGVDTDHNIMDEYILNQNYPNPFNPSTEISYYLPVCQNVSLVVYDIKGRYIKTLVNGKNDAGKHYAFWDGSDESGNIVSSGVYLYRLQTEKFVKTGKAMFVK